MEQKEIRRQIRLWFLGSLQSIIQQRLAELVKSLDSSKTKDTEIEIVRSQVAVEAGYRWRIRLSGFANHLFSAFIFQ